MMPRSRNHVTGIKISPHRAGGIQLLPAGSPCLRCGAPISTLIRNDPPPLTKAPSRPHNHMQQ